MKIRKNTVEVLREVAEALEAAGKLNGYAVAELEHTKSEILIAVQSLASARERIENLVPTYAIQDVCYLKRNLGDKEKTPSLDNFMAGLHKKVADEATEQVQLAEVVE